MNAGKQFSSSEPPAYQLQCVEVDNGDGTVDRIKLDADSRIVTIERVNSAGTRDTSVASVELDLSLLTGTNKDMKIRQFNFKDANDSCAWKKMWILATEPETL
jgi:hypothetical protein